VASTTTHATVRLWEAQQARTARSPISAMSAAPEQQNIRSVLAVGAFAQDQAQRAALRRLRSQFEDFWDPTEIALHWAENDATQNDANRTMRVEVPLAKLRYTCTNRMADDRRKDLHGIKSRRRSETAQ
jgi:hypothetical protein